MPITRRALLIANPGEAGQENYCRGVYADINNYRHFLTSAPGGAWNPEIEIKYLNKPTKKELAIPLIKCELADYSFILFTGHGYFSEDLQEPVLELGSGETICLSELLAPNTKRTVVLDCCQKIHKTELLEERNIIKAAMAESRRREPDREACRRIFDEEIEAAAVSAVIPQSCHKDEYSTADDELGSRYATSLIVTGERWARQQATAAWPAESCSIVAAHKYASEMTTRLSAGDQNPTITKAKSGPYFPFAVFG
jgi:hypothetical protein